jgi:hypothetical protein
MGVEAGDIDCDWNLSWTQQRIAVFESVDAAAALQAAPIVIAYTTIASDSRR